MTFMIPRHNSRLMTLTELLENTVVSIEMIIIAVVALVIGIIIGTIINRTVSPQASKSRALESRLQDSEQKLTEYQQEVTEHFADTAKLVNNLTQSYKDVHEHLANNALRLANVDISRQLLSSSPEDGTNNEEPTGEELPEPPKDWAPKTPDEAGTLREDYGLQDEAAPQDSPEKTL